MGERTGIAWTHATFNPWIGCSKVSPGCANCYASVDTFARRFRANGIELWGPNAARHRTSADYWKQPARWNRKAEAEGVRRRVFCGSLCDVAEQRPDLVPIRRDLVRLVEACPALDFLFLTKRPEYFGASFPEWRGGWPRNVWAGTTVEDQQRADERIPHLLRVPAVVRFLSCEPLLEAVDLSRPLDLLRVTDGWVEQARWQGTGLSWIIVGCESGPRARPCDIAWVRSIVAQCKAAGVPVFVKQLSGERGRVVSDLEAIRAVAPDLALRQILEVPNG